MINLPLQQPIPTVAFSQQPIQSLRVDNRQLRPVPQPSQVFQSKASKSSTSGSVNNVLNSVSISSKVVGEAETVRTASGELVLVGQQTNSSESNALQDVSTTNQKDAARSERQSSEAEQETADQRLRERAEQAQQTQEQQIIRNLSSRDREVRAHEQAHATVGGALAGAPSFQFTRGPNGQLFAVSGEVSISSSTTSSDPQAKIANLEKVIRAALAPAQPSGQDIRVAASASAALAELRSSLAAEQSEESLKSDGNSSLESDEGDNATVDSSQSSSAQFEVSQVLASATEEVSPFRQNLESRIQNSGALIQPEQESLIGLSA